MPKSLKQMLGFYTLIMANKGSNQSLQPTAGRCDDRLDFMKQLSMFATLAPPAVAELYLVRCRRSSVS